METNKKKAYQKPQLQEVKLVPEEAVLAGCKTTATARTGNSRPCGPTSSCTGAVNTQGTS